MPNTTNHAKHYRAATEHLLDAVAHGIDTPYGTGELAKTLAEAFQARRAANTNAERLIAEQLHVTVRALQREQA